MKRERFHVAEWNSTGSRTDSETQRYAQGSGSSSDRDGTGEERPVSPQNLRDGTNLLGACGARYRCPHPVYDAQEGKCIFHLPKDVSSYRLGRISDAFESAFETLLQTHTEKGLDLSYFDFPPQFNLHVQSLYARDLYLRGATLREPLVAGYVAESGEDVLLPSIDLSEAVLLQGLSFGAACCRGLTLNAARFEGRVDLYDCLCEDGISANSARFEGELHLDRVSTPSLSLKGAVFGSRVSFSAVTDRFPEEEFPAAGPHLGSLTGSRTCGKEKA